MCSAIIFSDIHVYIILIDCLHVVALIHDYVVKACAVLAYHTR